jgi:hypothetical protein
MPLRLVADAKSLASRAVSDADEFGDSIPVLEGGHDTSGAPPINVARTNRRPVSRYDLLNF